MRRLTLTTRVAVGITLALGATACGGDADGSASDDSGSKTRVAIATGAYGYLPPVMVQRADIMADKGVEVETIPLNNTTAISAVTSDSVDVIGQGVDLVITANEQGEDLMFFCRAIETNPVNMVALVDSPIKGADDGADWKDVMSSLVGKNVGVPALGSTTELQVQTLAKVAGIDYSDLTIVPVGTGAAAQAALEGEQVDALVTVPFVPQQLTTSGAGKVLIDFNDVPETQSPLSYAWAAEKEWLDEDPQRAQDLCDAFHAVPAFVKDAANRDVLNSVMQTEYGITDEATIDVIIGDGGTVDQFGSDFDCDVMDEVVDNLVERGVVDKAPPCDELLWTPPAA